MLPDPRGGPQDGSTAQGDHGHEAQVLGGTCGPAQSSTRTVGLADPPSNIYWCDPDGPSGEASGHLMTATPYTGYGLLSFTPKRSFTNVQRVCWDQNLTFLGGRRWTIMNVIPEAVFQSNDRDQSVAPDAGTGTQRLDYAAPGFGPGHDVGVLNLHSPSGGALVRVFVGAMFWYPNPGHEHEAEAGNGPADFGNGDKATRYRHCITDNENGTVTLAQARPGGGTWSDTFSGGLPNGTVRVLFQDDRYDTSIEDHPITWHWDNIEITEEP